MENFRVNQIRTISNPIQCMIDLSKKYHFEKFSKEQRSSFAYWYYHGKIKMFI